MPKNSDLDHWRINAKVYGDRVEEIHYIVDPARNIRRKQQLKVWQVKRSLGNGGFGEVRLEENKEDGKVRAVKKVATASTDVTEIECEKEIKALLEFSKPKVCQIQMLQSIGQTSTDSYSLEKQPCSLNSWAGSRLAVIST